jgi:uncharacterized protein (TIGR02302 family)
MSSFSHHDQTRTLKRLRRPLGWTRFGMISESIVRSFWPLLTVCLLVLAALMMGLHEIWPLEVVWGLGVLACLAAFGSLIYAIRRWQWPSRDAALARLDETLAGRPIRALLDDQAIGDGDPASMAVWRAHKARMAQKAGEARAVAPDLRVSRRDPFALRYVATLAFAVALLFGSIWRVSSVTDLGTGASALVSGPVWEGWVEPPAYTGWPTLYLNDQKDRQGDALEVPEGSRITLRFYGEVGALSLAETVSGRTENVPAATDVAQEFTVTQSGEIAINGPGGMSWPVTMLADAAPEIEMVNLPGSAPQGQISMNFTASDDYSVVGGVARIELDMASVDRRYGLALDPEPREVVEIPLPMPITGDRSSFEEVLLEDFSQHPWANLPVTISLSAVDALEQTGAADPVQSRLIARRFFDPMAAAVIEQRRDMLWNRDNAARIAQMLRAISHEPDDVFRSEASYLRLRFILRRLEAWTPEGLTDPQVEELTEALWDLALLLEDGSLADAAERLRRAQERLSEAMKNGASDEEIAELMQELREATDDYMRQLAEQQRNESPDGNLAQGDENTMTLTQNDLQAMMDRIQELMEQGRMAEAEQALREYQEMMENMQITQGQQGQGGDSPGQQAMEGLAETLREQQGLSDDAFRDLQEQFNPDAQAGESQGNEGRNGGQGRGQSHEGQQGEGQGQAQGEGQQGEGQQQGEGGQQQGQGQAQGQNGGEDGAQGLADRQQALRDELRRQQGSLPGAGTPEGDAARDALDRAGRAMEGAEDALRQDDFAGAIDQQSEAMEALREGMRNLGDAMAQNQQNQPGQGTAESGNQSANQDPLGRNQNGSTGALGTDEGGLGGEDVYRRARDLLDEIRRRAGEGERPEAELDYLRRLLERF